MNPFVEVVLILAGIFVAASIAVVALGCVGVFVCRRTVAATRRRRTHAPSSAHPASRALAHRDPIDAYYATRVVDVDTDMREMCVRRDLRVALLSDPPVFAAWMHAAAPDLEDVE